MEKLQGYINLKVYEIKKSNKKRAHKAVKNK